MMAWNGVEAQCAVIIALCVDFFDGSRDFMSALKASKDNNVWKHYL